MGALALCPADLREFDGEARVQDLRLAEVLGFENPVNIRKLIRRNLVRLEQHGVIFSTVEKIKMDAANPRGSGRRATVYYLNEHHVYRLCMWSEAPNADAVQEQMVEVFYDYRHGKLVGGSIRAAHELIKPDPWEAMERRLSQLENLIRMLAVTESREFARAVTHSPSIFTLLRPDGTVRVQSRFRWWGDVQVREAIIRHHRQMTIDRAVATISEECGSDRAPSRSSLGRFWKMLDQNRSV